MTEKARRLGGLAWRAAVLAAASLLVFIVSDGWNGWVGRRGWQSTDDAYLQADITPVSAKVGGYVRSVPVADFEAVAAGQLVAEIVDDDYRAARAQAEAGIASARAQAEGLTAQVSLQQANIEAGKAVIAATMAQLTQNDRDLARQKRLLDSGSSTAEAGERLQTTRDQLTAQLAQNKAQLKAAQDQIAVLDAQRMQARAAIDTQSAATQLADINLGYTRIVAPQAGVLGQRQVRQGQYVSAGTQITTLTPLPKTWVIANFKETQLTHMAVGQRSEIAVDAFPGVVLKGRVTAFSPGSGSQYALLPPDNATGNFTKVVQRVAVKIEFDDLAGLGDRLRAGMSVAARVEADGS